MQQAHRVVAFHAAMMGAFVRVSALKSLNLFMFVLFCFVLFFRYASECINGCAQRYFLAITFVHMIMYTSSE